MFERAGDADRIAVLLPEGKLAVLDRNGELVHARSQDGSPDVQQSVATDYGFAP